MVNTSPDTANTETKDGNDGNNNGITNANANSVTWQFQTLRRQVDQGLDEVEDEKWWHFWKLRMRGFEDDDETDWWFASTAVPLTAATLGPLANVFSISALVSYWRENIDDGTGNPGPQLSGTPYADPRWVYWLNVVSLICGFVGNIFLLFNFTGKVRYIISLPATIFFWYTATAILVGLTAATHIYVPPIPPLEVYAQGYWYAVFAAVLYGICSMLLMINMLGYFWGHYPQRFDLTDGQRTLIIQTMLFFVWLAGGGAVFSRIESSHGDSKEWPFIDGLYFCDVTILTIGFGDLYPSDDLGRGLVVPYSIGGIIMLGLVVASLHKFASELGANKVVKKHIDKERSRAFEHSTTRSSELAREEGLLPGELTRSELRKLRISAPFNMRHGDRRPSTHAPRVKKIEKKPLKRRRTHLLPAIAKHTQFSEFIRHKKPKLVLMKEERDRFNEMRRIQDHTAHLKRWWQLTLSIAAFSILWCVGAVVFWRAERPQTHQTYFQTLYFCYVSLLTIGYGEFAPKSNAGRAFFVVWSLIAVPTITILISDMSSTVIDAFKRSTSTIADFTVLPKRGVWRNWLDVHPRLLAWIKQRKEERESRKRLRAGMQYGQADDAEPTDPAPPDENELETSGDNGPPSIDELARESERDEAGKSDMSCSHLARQLAIAIRNVAADLTAERERKYTYEEWVEFTRLIRFTSEKREEAVKEEEREGMVEWDWIGEDSPMMSGVSEAEFVLDRLCESLRRYVNSHEKKKNGRRFPTAERDRRPERRPDTDMLEEKKSVSASDAPKQGACGECG